MPLDIDSLVSFPVSDGQSTVITVDVGRVAYAAMWGPFTDRDNPEDVDGYLSAGESRTFDAFVWVAPTGDQATLDVEIEGGVAVVLGTQQPATAMGTLVGAAGLYDQDGNLQGYVPVYDSFQEIAGPPVSARLVLSTKPN